MGFTLFERQFRREPAGCACTLAAPRRRNASLRRRL